MFYLYLCYLHHCILYKHHNVSCAVTSAFLCVSTSVYPGAPDHLFVDRFYIYEHDMRSQQQYFISWTGCTCV